MATMRDVAEQAGVSVSTVSHVLNSTRYVDPTTEQRVRAAMQALGYRPNMLARSLRRSETNTLGLLVPDNANPYWAELARVVEDTGYAHDYSVVLCNSSWSREREQSYVQMLLNKQIDGIILASATRTIEVLDDIIAAQVPVVVVGYAAEAHPVSLVAVNDYHGGKLAGEYLARLGHREVGCIAPPTDGGEGYRRVDGFRDALSAAGIALPDSACVMGDYQYRGGEIGVQTLLARFPDVTAVYATNDLMALGVIKGLRRSGRRVPDDVSVIGFDNISYTTAVSPELTTIAQPIVEIGRTAVQLLFDHINRRARLPERKILNPTLIERESCRVLT